MKLVWAGEGMRMFREGLRKRIFGIRKYEGDAEAICSSIIEDCWNGQKQYFMVSPGHFCEFYIRDFGWCIEPLLRLGHSVRVKKTLEYALKVFEENGAVTTSINPKGKAFDFPRYGVDSVPYLVYCLEKSDAKSLVRKHQKFLDAEVSKYVDKVVEPDTGLVRKDIHLSSARDHSIRKSSCYGNAMLGMLSNSLDKLKMANPLSGYDYPKLLKKHFWNGKAFTDDLSGDGRISGDANVFPFWCGVIKDKSMLNQAIRSMQKLRLDKPFPLKYGVTHPEFNFADVLVPNYEGDTIWTYLGMHFIGLTARVDKRKAKAYLKTYTKQIEKHRTFFELFTPEGEPFKTALYVTDDAMLWASLYLDIRRIEMRPS